MRSRPGLVLAVAAWLFAATAAAQVGGTIIAESERDFSRSRDVVLPPDGAFLYVADVGSDSIRVLDPATLITLGAFGANQLSGPHDVAFDRRGRLLVADTHNHRIAIHEVSFEDGVGEAELTLPVRDDGACLEATRRNRDVVSRRRNAGHLVEFESLKHQAFLR